MRARLCGTLFVVGLLAGLHSVTAWSQSGFPSRPVKIIVPATPGGTSDIFARAIANKLQDSLGKPVVVEYKPGAATNIGTDLVAKSAPDGHTLLINGITLATNPLLFANLPYNTTRDFAPIIEVAEMLNVVTVHPSVPVSNMRELVQLIKSQPGVFNHGTPGVGSSGFLSAELLAVKTGAKITHISYQGNAQAVVDHLGGILQVGFVNLPVALQHVKTGKLKALAVTSSKRSPLLPDVPTVAEAMGLPDFELVGWFGLLAPSRTPPEVVARLHAETLKALRDPSVIEVIQAAGGSVGGGSSAQFEARIRRDAERLTEVIQLSGASAK